MVIEKWNDDRLDELNRRVTRVLEVETTVAVINNRLNNLETSLARANDGIVKVSEKLGEVADEPLLRARDFRKQVLQGVIAAFVGGTFVFIATLLAGAVH